VTVLGIIPARHASTRFPGKPLVVLAGKPMIQWVHERARAAASLDELVVATDDERIRRCVEGFGGRVVMTSPSCATGTDRAAEVARAHDADVVVNIQGDEPLLRPQAIDACVQALAAAPDVQIATVAAPLLDEGSWLDPSVVKVVMDAKGRALYFSRAPIPWQRDAPGVPRLARRHVGLYAFRRTFLSVFAAWPKAPLEECEGLEQLRALHHGVAIVVATADHEALAVDVPGDVPAVEARLRALSA
jgi:3-deoxy-manno-octulosonate cytidylyltransferase (CMP-KDO synthetase)